MSYDIIVDESILSDDEVESFVNGVERFLYDEAGYEHNLELLCIRETGTVTYQHGKEYQAFLTYDTRTNKQGKGSVTFTLRRPNGQIIEDLHVIHYSGFHR